MRRSNAICAVLEGVWKFVSSCREGRKQYGVLTSLYNVGRYRVNLLRGYSPIISISDLFDRILGVTLVSKIISKRPLRAMRLGRLAHQGGSAALTGTCYEPGDGSLGDRGAAFALAAMS